MPILTDISLSGGSGGAGQLEVVYVQIVSGYEAGQDLLSLSGLHPEISVSWSVVEGKLSLLGPASINEFEAALRDVRYQTSEVFFENDKTFTVNLGEASYLPSSGHYYIYVSDEGINWRDARDAAESMEYFGLQGYLLTVSSDDEVELSGEQSLGTGWIGASDSASEGIWRWVTGPENGTIFWEGNFTGSAPNGAFAFWNDGEPNNFGEEHYAHITDPSVGPLGSWNDLQINGDPPGPYHPQGYMVEFGGMPEDPDITVSGSTIIRTPRFDYTVNTICQAGEAQIIVSTNTDNITWYASPSSNEVLGTGLEYNSFIDNTTTFWVSALFEDCLGGPRIPVTVEVFPDPVINDLSVVQCGDSEIDGISTFRLANYRSQLLSANSTEYEPLIVLRFFEDEELTAEIDDENFENRVNPQVVYAYAENTITGCSATSELTLMVAPSFNEEYEISICDDFIEDGYSFFDLNEASSQMLQFAPGGAQVSYYRSYEDALLEDEAIPVNYFNEEPYYQEIYGRINSEGNCFSINKVDLIVNTLPPVEDLEVVYYCLNDYPEPLKISGAVLSGIPNNYYYQWSTGETTIEIDVNQTGDYEVLVTEVGGCTNRKIIRVLSSEMAIVSEVTVVSETPFSTLVVQSNGIGEYLYALDDINGPYQEFNVFQNVTPGIHKVFVKDIKGNCGTTETVISVVGYPVFFTPNNDGLNDLWGLKGFNSSIPFKGRVQIFDRMGKLLGQLSETNPFWDGTYQGQELPSNDYWFVATLDDGRQISGHFSLKR